MPKQPVFYGDDLAFVHDTGYRWFVDSVGPAVLGFLQGAGIEDGLVVDLGCGGGIWARSLVDAGYQVRGLDFSPAMVALSRERVPEAKFEVGSLWRCRLPRCRAVTALGEVVCYLADARASKRNLPGWFRRVFQALEPGGLLVFDVAELGLSRGRVPLCREGDDWANLVWFEYDDRRNRLTRQITTFRRIGEMYRRTEERHVLQCYHAAEVADMLRAAGFRTKRVRAPYPGVPGHVGFVARKP